jgi:hypothetical protein
MGAEMMLCHVFPLAGAVGVAQPSLCSFTRGADARLGVSKGDAFAKRAVTICCWCVHMDSGFEGKPRLPFHQASSNLLICLPVMY